MRPIIVLGASVRAAAFSAIRARFAPYAIDMFADRDLAAVGPTVKIARYPGEFLSALAAAPPAPWLYTGGLENHPRLVDRLAEIRPLLGNRGSVLRLVRDPLQLASVVQSAGLPFPSMAAPTGEAAEGRMWLVKPRRSGGGLGIRFATIDDFHRPPRGAYLQRHTAGEAASAVFVAAGRQATLVGVTRQILGRDFSLNQPFLYAGSIGPLKLREYELTSVRSLGDVLTREFGLVGLFNVDFVLTKENLWTVEVNPRYSASIEVLERAADVDCVGLHVAACEMAAVPEQPSFKEMAVHGKAIVYAPRDAIVAPRFDSLVKEWNQPGTLSLIADLPRVGESIRAGQPVATVFAQGDTLPVVESELRRRVAAVHDVL